MERPVIRPAFSISLAPGADEAMAVLRERLQGSPYKECSRSKGRCADFFVEEGERRLWSPYLSVQVEPRGAGSFLRGRFGPHPELWTFFMFLYGALGFLAVMGLMAGFVQWQSAMVPWGFWGLGAGIPGLAILYAVSYTGQRLSAHQMGALRQRIEELTVGLQEGEEEAQSPST